MIKESKQLPIWTLIVFIGGIILIGLFFNYKLTHNTGTEFIFNIIAVLVGFSRIFLGVHYPTDIIGGMMFAFIFYKILI